MIQFGRLLSFPLTFKNLTDKLKTVDISEIKATKSARNIQILANANGHVVELNIIDEKININSPVQLYCDCDFFKYNLAYTLYKNKSLLHTNNFVLMPPRKKNQSMQLSGCKHIILVCQSLWLNKNVIVELV